MSVEFTIQAASSTGCLSKDFVSLAHLRDYLRSVFFSKKYKVRGPNRMISTNDGFEIGEIISGL